MKMRIYFPLILFVLFTLLLKAGVCQITYTTLSDGSWNNPNVWSTNGVTPCFCSAAYNMASASVIINHHIVLSTDLIIGNGADVLINPTGSLTGINREIVASNGGSIVSYGPIVSQLIEIEAGSNGDFHETVNCIDKFRVEGTAQVDSAVDIASGDFEVKDGAVLTLIVPHLEVNVPAGEFKNDGIINFNNTCLYILHGDFRNKATGFLNGTGNVEVQDGDIRDEGFWSTGINWCCGGVEETMPFAEDCNGCLLILPIDLISFSATTEGNKVLLKWVTATEINTDHYVVERSVNARDWLEAGKVAGVTNTIISTQYSFHDQNLPSDKIVYYRIGNVDIQGHIDYSHVVAVSNPVLRAVDYGYYNVYGRFFEKLEHAPTGVYIEVFEIERRIIYHHEK